MKNKKYAVHPGRISTRDGKIQHIGYKELIRLYELNPEECLLWDYNRPETYLGLRGCFIHVFPRNDGDYDASKL